MKFSAFILKNFSWNITKFQLNQTTDRKNENNNCLNELKFCEVSRSSISNRWWKFQLWILKNKKVLLLKKYSLGHTSKIDPKDGISCPNFEWRFWYSVSLHCTLHCHGIIYAHSKTKFTRMSARLEKFVSIQHSKLRLNL